MKKKKMTGKNITKADEIANIFKKQNIKKA